MMVVQSSLGPGKTFGELALRTDKQNPTKQVLRAATITTTSDTILAVIDKHNYTTVLDHIEKKNHENTI